MSRVSELMKDVVSFDIEGAESGDVTYTHSVFGTFNVTRIRRHVAERESIGICITNLPAPADLDEHRVAELMEPPDHHDLHAPVLLIDCEDGTHIMIDGTHRTAAKLRLGYQGTQARIATLSEVKPFMIHIRARKADGTYIDERELDRAFLEADQGRHNAPDGQPRPGSTAPGLILPGRARA